MITTTEMKVAENEDEAFWEDFKRRCVKDIKTHEREIIINKFLVELAEKELVRYKNGE